MATSIGVGSDEQNRGVMDMIIKYTNNLMKPFEIFKLLQQAQGIPAATTLLIWQNLVKANPNHFIAYLEQLKKKDRDDQITQLNKARVLHNELKLLYQNATLVPNNNYCSLNPSHGDDLPAFGPSHQLPFCVESSPNLRMMENFGHDACAGFVDNNNNGGPSLLHASYPANGHGDIEKSSGGKSGAAADFVDDNNIEGSLLLAAPYTNNVHDGGVEINSSNGCRKSILDELDEAFEFLNENDHEEPWMEQ